MNTHWCRTAVLILLLVSASSPAQRKEVIGYYPSWKWNSRNGLVTPARLPYEKLTIINYAFFVPMSDGGISGKDTIGDGLYLRSRPSITELAHQHSVRVMLSLGGWEDSDNFPVVASTPPLRAAFAHSCAEAIRIYAFDGIDIDWEYPGYADHKGTAADKENFTALLQTLRDSLTAMSVSEGRRYLLTAAISSGTGGLAYIDINRVAEILDQLNIMTYDFYGPWSPLSNHNSPLYPAPGADTTRCVDAAFRLLHETLGVPASKINLGVPFYGHTYTACSTLNAPHHGADTVHFSKFGAFYYDIIRVLDKCARHWDDRAKVPYLVNTSWNLLISYDDEQSIRAKAQYVLDNKVHGLIIWEITGDFLPDGSTPLLNSLDDVLHPPKKTTD